MKDRLFGDRAFYKKLMELTLPIAFQSVMLAAVAAADALMLGSVDQDSMSAVSLATQIQFIQNMIIMSVVSAGTILGAQYWGRKDKKTLNEIFCLMLRISGITSILFFIGCVIFPRYMMLIFTNEEVLISIGCGYLRIAGWSYLLTGISQCYLAIMKVSDHAAMTAKISTAAVILNIVLNAVFIFGMFGLPAMGVRGAALATLSARIVEMGACLVVSARADYINPDLTRLFVRNKLLNKDFYKNFFPLLGAGLLWGVGFTSYSAFMGHMGTDAAAANSVTAVVRDLICCACNGLSAGGGILVGNELGAGNLERGKLYGDRVMKLSFVLGVISSLVMFALTP
ncbi:MAG: polysaccharide biosynthesis C-terminal domain-containing protein, partial [Clostridiales bacterium]|nr:polysaccharide biosynthesis C-terminal domain-containing protein [Candidatus Blautia equi]